MDEVEKIKRKIKKDFEDSMGIDDSDIPVHERFVKEEALKKLRKK
ncbi:MAG: hypothetical protein ABIH64_03200 [Nanoarchaeota archaeon]